MAASDNPFIRFRHHLDLFRTALGRGYDDAAWVALVDEADARVAAVAGTGFRITPLVDLTPTLTGADGGEGELPGIGGSVVAKVETANVAGSHKARHLFGLLLHLLIEESSRGAGGGGGAAGRPLAIASCGNAALGAAVVAASAGRALRVFVPVDANPVIVARLHALGADVRTCPRQPGQAGDPCVHALHEALDGGAEAFTVQGPLCPPVIDGARTLGLELAAQLDEAALTPTDIFIQVGGGALATAVMDGLARAWPERPGPRLHPVQARAAHPYVAGWNRIAAALLTAAGRPDPGDDRRRAALLADLVVGGRSASGAGGAAPAGGATSRDLVAELEARSALMTPWPGTPASVASGILDDLTYDWVTLMAHQIRTGGWPQLVDEPTFVRAAELAAAALAGTGLPAPDATGAAGLAGLLAAAHDGTLPARGPGQTAVVLLTGVDRSL